MEVAVEEFVDVEESVEEVLPGVYNKAAESTFRR
jgi:hypothetical protein